MSVSFGILVGFVAWFVVRYLLAGLYTVDQNERAVKVTFGRAERLAPGLKTDVGPLSEGLTRADEDRYVYPQLRVIGPGGPYFKWPWQKIIKVSGARVD